MKLIFRRLIFIEFNKIKITNEKLFTSSCQQLNNANNKGAVIRINATLKHCEHFNSLNRFFKLRILKALSTFSYLEYDDIESTPTLDKV